MHKSAVFSRPQSVLLVLLLSSGALNFSKAQAAPLSSESQSIYALKLKTIDGKELKLADYAGKVLMIVNTASGCGFTPQLKNLVDLKNKYGPQGFEVLAFPSNDFHQERSSATEIKKFADETYHINFPLMAEGKVTGASPLFKTLTDKTGGIPKDVSWNFEKFLIGKNGVPAARFRSKVSPDEPQVVKEIERLLAEKSTGPTSSVLPQ